MRYSASLFLFLVLLLVFTREATASKFELLYDWTRWVQFTTQHGLPSNRIYQMCEAGDGTPWALTEKGLAWYDGFQWNAFDATMGARWQSSFLSRGFGDSIIFVTARKFYHGNRSGFRLMTTRPVWHAVPFREGEFLFIADSLLFHLRDGVATEASVTTGLPPRKAFDLWLTPGGSIWVSTEDGLYRWMGKEWSLRLRTTSTRLMVNALTEDSAGNGALSIGTPTGSRGLWQWSSHSLPVQNQAERGDFIQSIEWWNGSLLAAHQSGEIRLGEDGQWRSIDPVPLQMENCQFISPRREGGLWVGTDRGLFLFRHSSLWTYKRSRSSDPKNRIHELLKTRTGDLWTATADGLLIEQANGTLRTIEEIDGRRLHEVTGLMEDGDGGIWVSSGYAFDGAYRWDGRNWRYFPISDNPDGARIHKIRKDRSGRLWFLGLSRNTGSPNVKEPGAFVYDGGRFTRWGTEEGLLNGRVYSFAEGPDGALWFGTARGMSRWLDGAWTHWNESNGLLGQRVYSLAVDNNNATWFCDLMNGVGRIDHEGNISYFTTADGLVSNETWELTFDERGRLWVTTLNGLSCYERGVWLTYDTRSGLTNPKLWPLLPLGDSIFVGTTGSGVAILNVAKAIHCSPRIILENPVVENGATVVRWKTFGFWGEPEPTAIRSRYRIGDGKWSDWGIHNKIALESLAPGLYTYEVQAKGLYGDYLERGRRATIEIALPWYKRALFLVPLAVLFLTVVLLGALLVQRKQKYHRELLARERKFKALVENGTQGIVLLDHAGKVIYVGNPLLGYSSGETESLDVFGLVREEDVARVRALFAGLLELPGVVRQLEFRAHHKDGSWRWLEVVGRNLLGEPAVGAIVVNYTDISERKVAEEQRRESEWKYRAIVEGTQAMLFTTNRKGIVTYVNDAVTHVLGRQPGELQGQFYLKFVHPDDRLRVHFAYRDQLARGVDSSYLEFKYLAPDGCTGWVSFFVNLARKDGEVTGLTGVAQEISERKAGEEKVAEHRSLLRNVIDMIPSYIFLKDTAGRLRLVNKAVAELRGMTVEELVGKKEDEFNPNKEERERYQHSDMEVFAGGGEVFIREEQIFDARGRSHWVQTVKRPLYLPDGSIGSVLGVATDITERKRSEDTLRASENRIQESLAFLRHLFASLPTIAFITTNLDGVITTFSVGAENIFECSANQMLGKAVGKLLPPSVAALFRAVPGVARSPQVNESREMILKRVHGGEFPAQCILSPVRNADGKEIALLFVAQDITERKKAEQAIFESEQRFRGTFEQAAVGMAHQGIDGKWLRFNQKYCDIIGYTREELLRLTFHEITHPDDLAIDLENVQALLDGRSVMYGREKRYLRKDGSCVWVNLTASLIRTPSGAPEYFIDVIEDISERRRVEEALRESEERYRIVAETATDAILTIDEEGKILFVNSATEKIFGYRAEELRGRNVTMIMPECLHHVRNEGKSRHPNLRGKHRVWESVQLAGIHREGGEIPLEASFGEYTRAGKHVFSGIIRDVTERRRIEEQLREQAALLDRAQEAIYVQILDSVVRYWNSGAVRLYGWTPEETIGTNMDAVVYRDARQLEEARAHVVATGEWTGELDQVTKDGRPIVVESHWSLLKETRGVPDSVLIINSDITERKNLEAQFLRSQRMESIGTLAGGIAHDLNNVLAPILMSIKILYDKIEDARAKQLLKTLEMSAKRGAELIKQVLTFARGIEGERVVLHFGRIIQEFDKILRETFPRSIVIQTELQPGLWNVSGDATQLHQVLMNLCVNARDAMPEGGVLRISARNARLTERETRHFLEAHVGQYILVEISDTGTGIPAAIIHKIFDPFFTTKEVGKGTGLGLSTVRGLVRGHGGFLNLVSQEGKGTTFVVYLPAVETEHEVKAPEKARAESRNGCGEMILIIDDEASILEITKSTLEAYGYRTMTASDGLEALELFRQSSGSINLVLTDMMMPNLDGPETVRALRQMRPDIKIIGSSGLALDERVQATSKHLNGFIEKPYSAEKLLKVLSEVLAESD